MKDEGKTRATYTLSGRQLKELLERGTAIHIAIPSPPEKEYDQLAFARAALPEVRHLIQSVAEHEISVRPNVRGDLGLASILGQIVQTDDARPGWTIQVSVLIVAVAPPGRAPARHQGAWQWPGGSVTFAGRTWGMKDEG